MKNQRFVEAQIAGVLRERSYPKVSNPRHSTELRLGVLRLETQTRRHRGDVPPINQANLNWIFPLMTPAGEKRRIR